MMKRLYVKQYLAHLLFWSWNVIFLAFMLLGFAPQILPEMLTAVDSGEIPVVFLTYAVVLSLIPALILMLGFWRFREQPGKLFTLGYGVEGPLMLLIAVRFFIVRQATPAVTVLLVIAAVGMLTLLWQLVDERIDDRAAFWTHVRVIGLTLMLAVGLYVSLWLSFYVLPVASLMLELVTDIFRGIADFFRNFGDFSRVSWGMIPFTVLGISLLIFTSSLFVVMPIAVPILYVKAWWRSIQTLVRSYSQPRAVALTTAVVVTAVTLVVLGMRQPQHEAFALLEEPPQSIEEAAALLEDEAAIRDGLLNAYLAPQRYISAQGEVYHIREAYEWQVGLPEAQAVQVQDWYETVASPILYQPVTPVETNFENRWQNQAIETEIEEAAELYEQFFDEPIIDGEREIIIDAVRTTWSIDQARANWQAVDDREIYLSQQEVTVTEMGDMAEVELYEVYENVTVQRQEVVYYFSLPESAVITGVWLGNSPDREKRYDYHVAPRGAAQAVYRNEVRRNVDPALVEQIGPRQYRLRVFPIEPQQWNWDEESGRSKMSPAPPLHMWLTWQVMATDEGWPMPKLAEKFNVFWDDESARLVNGVAMDADEETWLPATVASETAVVPQTHRFDFTNGQTVLAKPMTAADVPQLGGSVDVAVVLDRSRSMADHETAVVEAIAQLAVIDPEADLYLTSSPFRGEEPSQVELADFVVAETLYFGGQNAGELLVQFESLRRERAYDAIIVLTDGSGYELGDHELTLPSFAEPVWLVHLDEDYSLGYDDATLEAIQASGGGVAATIDEAVMRLLVGHEGRWASAMPDLFDGYLWLTMPTAEVNDGVTEGAIADSQFAPIASRRLILAEMAAKRDASDRLAVLDGLHAIAIEYSIVTPYSSMLVLVTSAQEKLLERLEGQADRFDREFEGIGETDGEQAITVTGVPEPEEWLLMGLALAFLGWYWLNERRQVVVT